MAVTKILARHARLDLGIKYILNGGKTEGHTLTAHLNCDPGRECRQMLDTKRAAGKVDGVQYYHMIQSFKPGEVSPELALDIAKAFAQEHLPGYEAVIAVHVDRQHITGFSKWRRARPQRAYSCPPPSGWRPSIYHKSRPSQTTMTCCDTKSHDELL